MILLDLFSGYGGFHLGLQQAGFKFKKTYFSEKDKHCIANYRYNFPEAEYAGTVEDVPGSGIKADIITFGSPCQGFSMAGKGAGMQHEGSGLVRKAVDIIAEQRPGVFIWENVKGVITKKHREDFWAVIQAFARIGGYRLQWQLCNTIAYLPQNRERIFLVGLAGTGSGCQIFPLGESDENIDEARQQPGDGLFVNGLDSNYFKGADGKRTMIHSSQDTKTLIRHRSDQPYKAGHVAPTLRNSDKAEVRIVQRSRGNNKGGEHSDCPTLSANSFEHNNLLKVGNIYGSNGQNGNVYDPKGVSPSISSGTTDNENHGGVGSCNAPKIILSQKDYSKGNADAERVYDGNGAARTLKGDAGGGGAKMGLYEVGQSIRRLTPTECSRLQGLPDDWLKYGNYDGEIKVISDSQQYKMAGNGVSIPPVREIGKKILTCA